MPATSGAYIDIPTLLAMGLGLDISGLVGLNTVLSSPAIIGATTLNVVSSGGLLPNQPVYILDGSTSEIVFAASSNPTPTESSITIQAPGLTYTHSANVSISSPGPSGNLAQVILMASGWIENECKQGTALLGRSLFSASRTERLRMPSTRAYITTAGALEVRPHFFPVTAVSSVAVETAPGSSDTISASQLELDATGRLVTFPVTQTSSTSIIWGPPVNRRTQAWCVVTYTAGLTAGALPWDFQQAVGFAVQEFAGAYPQNPTGAVSIRQESVEVVQRLAGGQGMQSVNGIFLAQACEMLRNYRGQGI